MAYFNKFKKAYLRYQQKISLPTGVHGLFTELIRLTDQLHNHQMIDLSQSTPLKKLSHPILETVNTIQIKSKSNFNIDFLNVKCFSSRQKHLNRDCEKACSYCNLFERF